MVSVADGKDRGMSNKPAWAGEYVTYEQVVDSWGYSVDEFETFGSYQGDHLALLSREGEVGLVVFGYGSCSGCDQLEAVTPYSYDDDDDADYSGLISLADDLKSGIHWEPTRDALRDWIDAHPENHWWSYEDDISKWLNANLGTHLKVETW